MAIFAKRDSEKWHSRIKNWKKNHLKKNEAGSSVGEIPSLERTEGNFLLVRKSIEPVGQVAELRFDFCYLTLKKTFGSVQLYVTMLYKIVKGHGKDAGKVMEL